MMKAEHGKGLFSLTRSSRAILVGAAVAMTLGAARARADTPFYEGKTVTLINGLAAGSSPDLQCRMVAQFLTKYIAGNPVVLVKNLPGAGGMNATNFVGKDAKKDGLTLICGSLDAQGQLTKNPGFATDLTKFNYITGNGEGSLLIVGKDVQPGMSKGEDIFQAKNLTFGGIAVDSNLDITVRLAMDTLGLDNYTYVTGLNGVGEMQAAVQQKFVNMLLYNTPGYLSAAVPTLIKTGVAIPVFQWGLIDDSGHLSIRDPRIVDIPTFREFYQAHFGKPVNDPRWDLIERIAGYNEVALAALALPSGAPPAAAAALRAAIAPMTKDPDFQAASDTLRGKGVQQQPPERITTALDRYLDMPSDMYQLFQDTIKQNGDLRKSK